MEDLKRYNTILFSFLILNVVPVGLLDSYLPLILDNFNTKKLIFLTSIILLSMVILNGVLSSDFKHKLVFMKMNNPLPASRLQKTLKNDQRVSIDQVSEKFGPIPDDSKQQNVYWYQKIYKPNQDSKNTRYSQKFLMTRDMTAICIIILFFSILNTLFLSGTWLHILVILCEYFIVRLVAANYGKRFVTTVIAESI